MKNKYKIYKPGEIEIRKQDTGSLPAIPDDIYNKQLANLRKRHFNFNEENKSFIGKILHFNKIVRSKTPSRIAAIIKIILKDG